MKAKKISFKFTFAAYLLTFAFILSGCGLSDEPHPEDVAADSTSVESHDSEQTDKTTLRVLIDELPVSGGGLTESMTNTGFKTQLSLLLLDFRVKYRDVEIVIEEVPSAGASRKMFLQRLNSELLAGEGPDVVLLRNEFTSNELQNYYEPVFDDVNLLMRNGIFYDVSEFYDADVELHTENLRKEVMDAGVLDCARYILPLRYDFPILYVDKGKCAENSIDLSFCEGTICDFLTAGSEVKDDVSASCFWMYEFLHSVFNFFPELIDYDNGKVKLSTDELENFLRLYQQYFAANIKYPAKDTDLLLKRGLRYTDYTQDRHWTDSAARFMQTGSLNDVMENVCIAKTNGIDLGIYPMRAVDGSVVANVTFYGAITAGCKNPELAYAFLREWLTEKYQWEQNISNGNLCRLSSYGWPVRSEGAYSAIANMWQKNVHTVGKSYETKNLTDEDFTILNTPIDVVRFGIPKLEYELGSDMWKLANVQSGALPVDFTEKAQNWIKKLQTHLDEG